MDEIKNEEINLVDEGFEELTPKSESTTQAAAGKSQEQPQKPQGQNQPGSRPDFRIVQPDRDRNGNLVYINVGGMWKNISKNGNEFYTMRIGSLKLLVFANNR